MGAGDELVGNHQALFLNRFDRALSALMVGDFDGGNEANDATVLVQGLTWADTVDLTSTME
jgi:hypothetical protein